MPLQIKRGTNTQRLAYTPSQGELVFVTDYSTAGVGPLWIGTGDVGTPYAEVSGSGGGGLTELSEDTTPELGGNLDLAGFEVTGIGDIDITGTITTSGAINSSLFVGVFDGDHTGSVFADDSTIIIDGTDGSVHSPHYFGDNNNFIIKYTTASAQNNLVVRAKDDRSTLNLIRESDSDLSIDLTTNYSSIFFTRDDANGALTTALITGRGDSLYFGADTAGDFSTQAKFAVLKQGKFGIKNTNPAVELDVTGDANITGSLTAGAMLLSGSIIDTSDSSPITVTPATTFSSDVTVQNNLIVTNTLTVDTLEVTNFQTSGSGTPELASDTDILLTAGTRVEITQSPLKMASFTTTERNALTPQNGDVIYNTTDSKFQGYAGGTWVNLH
jgi:hypothetical protein